jgi:hypothetical protein
VNETIAAAARARGITVDQLRHEASERLLQQMTPEHRAAVLLRESRRAVALREPGRKAPVAKPTGKPTSVSENLTPRLETAFAKLGMSEAASKIAAAGRNARPSSASMIEAGKALGLTPAGARRFARGRSLTEAVVKDGSGFVGSDYAYAPSDDPTTWRYLLVTRPGDGAKGAYDADLVTKAANALSVDDYAVTQPDVPKADLAAVKQTVAGAWTQAGLTLADMPPGLTEAQLRKAFGAMGLSDRAAEAAARGRS